MRTPEETYEIFVRKYPDVFDRREAISEWCRKCQDYYRLSRAVWKRLDMLEGEEDA